VPVRVNTNAGRVTYSPVPDPPEVDDARRLLREIRRTPASQMSESDMRFEIALDDAIRHAERVR